MSGERLGWGPALPGRSEPDADGRSVAAIVALLTTLPDDVPEAAAAVAARAALLIGTPVTVAVWSGHRWTPVAGPGTGTASLPADGAAVPDERPGAVTAPAGRVILCWDPAAILEPGWRELLRLGCAWLALVLDRSSAAAEIAAAAAETQAIGAVVQQLLSVHDLDLTLRTLTEQTLQLLDADICGVLLREGDVLRMRSCVGNRLTETGRIVMRRGQGVAGSVFVSGVPTKVDSYLGNEKVPQDFVAVAAAEGIRSALAVPLFLRDEFIGVLEVWRRRTSTFTAGDVRQMVSLADFVTIAIENARLHDEQVAATAEAEHARDALQRQMAILNRSAQVQQLVLTTVLDGGGLTAIALIVARDLECEVGVYGSAGELITSHNAGGSASRLPAKLQRPGHRHPEPAQARPTSLRIRPVLVDGGCAGNIVLVRGSHPVELIDAVSGHAAMACSLALLREQAAGTARAEMLEQLLWDLVEGSVDHRLAARTRVHQLGINLTRSLRVVHGQIENIEELAVPAYGDIPGPDRIRREVLRTVRAASGTGNLVLSGMRGNLLVAVAADVDGAAVRKVVDETAAALLRQLPDLRITWGVSKAHDDIVELPTAMHEARTAHAAARRLGRQNIALYEELGILRVLLGGDTEPDLRTFVDDVIAPLITYDRETDGALLRTLRLYFDANCSQRAAARLLFVHPKTLRYRLGRIRHLTGLDLSQHHDRVRADLALRILEADRSMTGEDGPVRDARSREGVDDSGF
ncbi:MAG: helix-turn-helix domain-containing protein [Pseudonocardia sp.]